jgi:hypothetical protein
MERLINMSDGQKHFTDSRPLFPTGVVPKVEPQNALEKQVGGGHYKAFGIQPVEYIHANNLNFFEGNIVKYITRYKSKNGIEDLKKVIHYAELIIELEYNQKKIAK